jgi:hypothetical protein
MTRPRATILYDRHIAAAAVLDVHGRTPEGLVYHDDGEGRLVVVDLYPDANWAHDCVWIWTTERGIHRAVVHRWPPR